MLKQQLTWLVSHASQASKSSKSRLARSRGASQPRSAPIRVFLSCVGHEGVMDAAMDIWMFFGMFLLEHDTPRLQHFKDTNATILRKDCFQWLYRML